MWDVQGLMSDADRVAAGLCTCTLTYVKFSTVLPASVVPVYDEYAAKRRAIGGYPVRSAAAWCCVASLIVRPACSRNSITELRSRSNPTVPVRRSSVRGAWSGDVEVSQASREQVRERCGSMRMSVFGSVGLQE